MGKLKYITIYTITALAVICFLASCEDNLKEVQKMELSSNEPIGEAENMLLKYTDSGLVRMTLQGKKMLDFSNDEFPYTHFPEGVTVEIFNKAQENSKTTITADRGLSYDVTDIIDLQGNVVVTDSDGNTFMGDQMYWNQKDKWIFTNDRFKTFLKNKDTGELFGKTSGKRYDSDQKLENAQVGEPDDVFINNNDNE
ncbi:MAG: LPS export ABC transporter periplasmic protein LptC [Nonlabens sp.]